MTNFARQGYRRLRQVYGRAKGAWPKIHDLWVEILTGEQRVMTKSQSTYWGDNSATMQHVEFLQDPKFQEARSYTLLDSPKQVSSWIESVNIDWRLHICTWAASHCASLEGDFVECGVWYGWLSRAMCKYIDFNRTQKSFYFFDSWGDSGSHEEYQRDIFDAVKYRFKEYPKVYFNRGMVPEVLSHAVGIEKIAYLSLDMNGGIAERQALDALYHKVVSGGVIYIDDYGWNYPLLRSEIEEFLRDKPEELLHFPCGSSLIIKS